MVESFFFFHCTGCILEVENFAKVVAPFAEELEGTKLPFFGCEILDMFIKHWSVAEKTLCAHRASA